MVKEKTLLMKKIYLILITGPEWISEKNERATQQQIKMERLIEKLLPYRTSSQILRSSTDRGHYVCSSEISASLCIHEHAETERFGWSYKTEDRHAHIEKYYLKQILADIESHELVVYVGYNTLTRDVPEYFDPKSSIIRTAGCKHCQAVVLEYVDKSFYIKEYLNIGD